MVRLKKNRKCEWKYCLWVETCTNLWAWPIPLRWHHSVLGVLGLNWIAPVMSGDVEEVSCLNYSEDVVLTREYLDSSLAFTFVLSWAKIMRKGCIVQRKGGVLPCKTDVYCSHVSKKCCSLIACFIFFKLTPHRKFASDPEMLPKKISASQRKLDCEWLVSWFALLCAKQEL